MGDVLSLHAQSCHFGMIDMQRSLAKAEHTQDQHAFAWDLGKVVTAS